MGHIIYRDFKDPATKKNHVPKWRKWRTAFVWSVVFNIILAMVVLKLGMK